MNHAQVQTPVLTTMSTKMRAFVATLFTATLLTASLALAAPAQATNVQQIASFGSKSTCQANLLTRVAEYSAKWYSNITVVRACTYSSRYNSYTYMVTATR